MNLLEKDVALFSQLSPELKSDPKIVLAVLQNERHQFSHYAKNGSIITQLSPELKSDPNFFLSAIRIDTEHPRSWDDGSIINHASDSLKSNDSFMLKAVEHNPSVLNYVPVLKLNKAFMLQAVQKEPSVYNLASDDLKKDIDFAKAYVDSSYKGVSPSCYFDIDQGIAIKLHAELRDNPVIKQAQKAAKLKYKAEFLKHQAAYGN